MSLVQWFCIELLKLFVIGIFPRIVSFKTIKMMNINEFSENYQ